MGPCIASMYYTERRWKCLLKDGWVGGALESPFLPLNLSGDLGEWEWPYKIGNISVQYIIKA